MPPLVCWVVGLPKHRWRKPSAIYSTTLKCYGGTVDPWDTDGLVRGEQTATKVAVEGEAVEG